MRPVFILGCLITAIATSQAKPLSFFEYMDMGAYRCNPEHCEAPELSEISLARMGKYHGFLLEGTTGFVLQSTQLRYGEHEIVVDWDDGSGRVKSETVFVRILTDDRFLFKDGQGRRNLMEIVE